jgi:hypothetical protein
MTALSEDHLGAAIVEVNEDDCDEFIDLIRTIGKRENEQLRLNYLSILALPLNLASLGTCEHRRSPGTAFPHVQETVSMGISASVPPNQSAKRPGSVHSFHTRPRGASNTRIIKIPARCRNRVAQRSSSPSFFRRRASRRSKLSSHSRRYFSIHSTDSLRGALQPGGPELRGAPPIDRTGLLQHLEMFRDGLDADREGLGEFGDGRLSFGQACDYRPAGRIARCC